MATAAAGVFAAAINIAGGGGGGGIVEPSFVLEPNEFGGGDVVDRLSVDVVGEETDPVPLVAVMDGLSAVVVVCNVSVFKGGDRAFSSMTGGGGGGGSSS